MATMWSKFSPVPAFPAYTGPHKVGSVDVEIPVTDLYAPSPAPDRTADVTTVQFRIYYPAVAESNQKPVSWLPNPQRNHVAAYTRFLGLGNAMADFLSFLPRYLHYVTIPVHKNAELKSAETANKRWPTMIFSHGLGSNRNTYSYIAGSLASHGLVVICPEHRDGSAITTFVRQPSEKGKAAKSHTRKEIPYWKISHKITPELYEQRESQLRVRFWEMGLIHDAILKMDFGTKFENMNASTPILDQFKGSLHVHEPGSIIWGGHSFGATTTVQLLKSTYWADNDQVKAMKKPLFTPAEGSEIRKQVTDKSVTLLLDMWCLPILAPNSEPLFNLPLPLYDDKPTASGGSGVLAVESEAFWKWTEHLHMKSRILSPDPTAKVVTTDMFVGPSGVKLPEPNFFYVVNSAHLSQSDFGILFPWLTKKIFAAEQPERALRLNLRAQLQLLRTNGIPIAATCASDLIDGTHINKFDATRKDDAPLTVKEGLDDDKAIFDRSDSNTVDHWKWIDTIGLGDAGEDKKGKSVTKQVEEGEEKMKGELEPAEASPPPAEALSSAIPA